MNRRAFITLLGGAAATWPLVAGAQSTVPVVGVLSGASNTAGLDLVAALRQGLKEAGHFEGRDYIVESRFADGQFSRLPGLAQELLARRPALISTVTLPGALAAKAATNTVPIVFVVGEDPVKAGLVASLNRPGGNVTGHSNFMNVLGQKRLDLVGQAVPGATILALLVNPNNPNASLDTADLKTAADAIGRQLQVLKATNDEELETAFMTIAQERVGALFVNIDPVFVRRASHIVALAARHRVPAIYPLREFVVAGGLMSYGASFTNAFRQAGIYAGRILKGEKPGDLPVQLPTKIELVINLKTVKALSLSIPPTLLALADEVIE
jgi:putative ABC transport system substrate-binding protein